MSDGGHDGPAGAVPTVAEIERAEVRLETWLVAQAEAGVPELVLVGLLRDYANRVEHLGRVPRRWGEDGGEG